MGDPFRPLAIEALARWVFRGLDSGDSVMGIPLDNLQVPSPRLASIAFGRPLAAPLGLAAGPHTQLAQNVVAGWLCGARFVELKTVQADDAIQVSRPCIDASDEGYNCEWSQELRLEQSFAEYLKAWVLLHSLAHRLGLPGPGTHFAMSVGYDLAGVLGPGVSRFIASMRDAGEALPAAVDAVAAVYPAVRDVEIPSLVSDHVTLSTMHGCPAAEIGRIGRYLIEEAGLHTWVKLNPTLLGPGPVRALLNRDLGWEVEVPDGAFDHDPLFPEAIEMARELARVARSRGREFGLKLSNTLEVVNLRQVLPPSEKTSYLSGRALHPLTLALARAVSDELGDEVPISFCGGADSQNFPDLVADGLAPVTVCTDLLKPGGYARLQQYLVSLEAAMERSGANDLPAFVDATSGGRGARDNLARHATRAAADERYAHREQSLPFKGPRPLGRFDCIAAPCQEACPVHQEIPGYLRQVAHGSPDEALEVILRTNPLPGTTGCVCDHPCTERCVRTFQDAPLAIREVKRFAFERGKARASPPPAAAGPRVAIVGAGPAGLAAACHLVLAGFRPEIFESRSEAGGMASGAIPVYRLDGKTLKGDLDRLRRLGVTIHFGRMAGRNLSIGTLRQEFPYIFLAVGALKGRLLGVPGEGAKGVLDALEFLARIRSGERRGLGRNVLVVGGGNSAIDAARSARRLAPEALVTLVYRRTRAEMPADPAEVRDALYEGVALRELLAPARVVLRDGRASGLSCTPMASGETDGSGRRRPVPSDGPEVGLAADTVITAIGQRPVLDFLTGPGGLPRADLARLVQRPDGTLVVDPSTGETGVPGFFAGGDVARGPASVIEAIADGSAVAREIARRHGVAAVRPPLERRSSLSSLSYLLARRARREPPRNVPVLPVSRRGGFAEIAGSLAQDEAVAEAARCLDCDKLCSLCVTVCPNRANLAFLVAPITLDLPVLVRRGETLVTETTRRFSVEQEVQVLTVGDLCNECGNCDPFCPAAGSPHRDKPRFWLDRAAFDSAKGDAFRLERAGGELLIEARLDGILHRLTRTGRGAEYRTGPLVARFDGATWRLLEARTEGEEIGNRTFDLAPAFTLAILLHAEEALPYS